MQIEYYPNKQTVDKAKKENDPLLVLVSFNGERLLVSNIDDAYEHIILLRQLNYNDTDIDKYFRIVVNSEGADWTFVCPSHYKNIQDKNKRIEVYYNDGILMISSGLKKLGYDDIKIDIPKRYRRHFNMLKDDYEKN